MDADNEEVVALGKRVARRNFLRTSRDDTLGVAVDRRACEVFLLLACDFPALSGRYESIRAPRCS